jgi:hypothetical protein
MTLAAFTVVLLMAGPGPGPGDGPRLEQLVREIQSADYRGERERLRRLVQALEKVKAPGLADYLDYWRGFALWRRALNGFNETPAPADLGEDLEAAVVSFRAALGRRPGWLEAQVGLVGCTANLMYLARGDKARQERILAEHGPMGRELHQNGGQNPRALWIMGGLALWAPPPHGGDARKALALYRRGLEASRQEALDVEGEPAWVPAWGGPEILMSLSFLHAQGPQPDRALAQAYLDGALTAVPHWRYVAEVLRPQVEGMAAPPAAPGK